jgi:uncharacterized membrane protein
MKNKTLQTIVGKSRLALATLFCFLVTLSTSNAQFTAADVTAEIATAKTAAGTILGTVAAIWGMFILVKLAKRGVSKV